jgi:glutamate formiminotransferase/formiminotetrahydrofolate cyclodeaminase
MNLTNFQKTPLAQVVEFVRREAQRYGVAVHHSELVGLIPQKALTDAAVWYLQLDQYEDEQLLENKLMSAAFEQSPVAVGVDSSFLDELASASPTPGGGSAAAWTAAEAAALVAMVARLTVGKGKYKDVEPLMVSLTEQAEKLRAKLQQAVQEDALAFEKVMAAFRLPKDSEEQLQLRKEAVQIATLEAARIPLGTARMALEVMRLAEVACASGNLNAITDAASAVQLAAASLSGAAANVSINLNGLDDEQTKEEFNQQLASLKQEKEAILTRVAHSVTERSHITLI